MITRIGRYWMALDQSRYTLRQANHRGTRLPVGLFICLAVVICWVWADGCVAQELRKFQSNSYIVHTDMSREEVQPLGRHMDAVFSQYEERFRDFPHHGPAHMPLYLLRTEREYHRFMAGYGIDATNTGGMFFYTPQGQGLATWVRGRSRSQTYQVLQHEGFHQFAFNRLGSELPTWINEGLAQYFEDAIIVGDKMTTGLANARRVELVRQAVENGTALGFAELVNSEPQVWADALRGDPHRAALLYAQSWSIVYYMIHGDNQRYQPAFAKYLQRVSNGRDSGAAFEASFGVSELRQLERKWQKFAREQTPDPINAAASRMEFLGEALRYIHQNGEQTPRNIGQLRRTLQERHFVLTRKSHGLSIEMDSMDPELYRYQRSNGTSGLFKLLEPARNDLPARITAAGLRPEPTLVWSRDADGKLVQDIEYR